MVLLILRLKVKKIKIWFKEFTAVFIFILHKNLCNQSILERRSEENLSTRSNISKSVWSPSIFDNDEVSQVYGEKELRDLSRWTRFTTMMILLTGKSQRNGKPRQQLRRQELSPDMNKIKKKDKEVNKYESIR